MKRQNPLNQLKQPIALSLLFIPINTAAHAQNRVEEIVVVGRQEFLETEFTTQRTGSNVDAAKLMNQVDGGTANNNGPLTEQIKYRGMFGPRMNVRVDGMLIHGGGIGGAATAYWKRPDYNSDNGWEFSGDTEAAVSSVDDGTSLSGVCSVSMRSIS